MCNQPKVANKQEVMSHITWFTFFTWHPSYGWRCANGWGGLESDWLLSERPEVGACAAAAAALRTKRVVALWLHQPWSDRCKIMFHIKDPFDSLDQSTTCWPGAKWTTVPLTRITAACVCFPGLAFERSNIDVLKSVSIRHTSWFGHHNRWWGGAEGKGQGAGLLGAGSLSLIANQTRLEPRKSLIPVKGSLII